ncbi:hypothetical protein KDN24_06860 [Bacillus sp. Bva_UNVM-123]|uniref:hypothetical protein n=1 Tax=Bacillus sp. Bva_UNVM-123 TaxID=2829798 RepID=UPI00391F1532
MKMYFEFEQHEYYGLITVESDPKGFYIDDAASVYVETVGGENVDEVLEEGHPRQVTKEYAFWKLANCNDSKEYSVEELLREFEKMENTCVVIDGTLV